MDRFGFIPTTGGRINQSILGLIVDVLNQKNVMSFLKKLIGIKSKKIDSREAIGLLWRFYNRYRKLCQIPNIEKLIDINVFSLVILFYNLEHLDKCLRNLKNPAEAVYLRQLFETIIYVLSENPELLSSSQGISLVDTYMDSVIYYIDIMAQRLPTSEGSRSFIDSVVSGFLDFSKRFPNSVTIAASVTLFKNILGTLRDRRNLGDIISSGDKIFQSLHTGGSKLSMPLLFTIYDIVDYYFNGVRNMENNRRIADYQKRLMMYAIYHKGEIKKNFIVFPPHWPHIFINRKYFDSLVQWGGLGYTLDIIRELFINALTRYFGSNINIADDPLVIALLEYLRRLAGGHTYYYSRSHGSSLDW